MVIDAFFRFSAITLLLFVAIVLIRDLRHSKNTIYLFLACVSLIALFLGYTPEYIKIPYGLTMLFRFMDVPHLIFVWLFALSLFQKDFKLTKFHWIVGVFYSFTILYVRFFQYKIVNYLPSWWITMVEIGSVLIMIHILFFTLYGHSDDLLDKRRKSRLYFIFLIATIGISAALTEYISGIYNWNSTLPTSKVLTIWPAVVWLSFWVLSSKSTTFSFDSIQKPNVGELSSRDKSLNQKLEKEILENRIYLKNGLTIASLAKKIAVSPHRLRAFINQTLGHENFSSYINTFRIQAIKKAFSESQNDHIPILSIAMQYGFNSLSPFNRAFKIIEGTTPSEYRQKLKKT